jgi:septin family protein
MLLSFQGLFKGLLKSHIKTTASKTTSIFYESFVAKIMIQNINNSEETKRGHI